VHVIQIKQEREAASITGGSLPSPVVSRWKRAKAWWTGPISGDGIPSGYGVYKVDDSDIRWYYNSTDKTKEHQLRI
jgi:hypothetical protein